jgi:hypothetical protein
MKLGFFSKWIWTSWLALQIRSRDQQDVLYKLNKPYLQLQGLECVFMYMYT